LGLGEWTILMFFGIWKGCVDWVDEGIIKAISAGRKCCTSLIGKRYCGTVAKIHIIFAK
jgi:hypothetical protein